MPASPSRKGMRRAEQLFRSTAMAVRPGRGRRGVRGAAAGGDGHAGRLVGVRRAGHLGIIAGRVEAQPADVDGRHGGLCGPRRADGHRAGPYVVRRPAASSGRWCCCHWCCRRWSAASRCCTRSVVGVCSARRSGCSGCRSPSPPRRWCSRRPLWRCRFWWSALRAPCGRSDNGTRWWPPRWVDGRPRCCGGSRCRWCCPGWCRGRCCRSPGRSASSAPRSRSPAACRV